MKTGKTIIEILSAAMMALTLSSCQKEEFDNPAPETDGTVLAVDITVTDLMSGSVETKAVKKGWTDGDVIDIWYDDNLSLAPDLAIKYNAGKWEVDPSITTSGKQPDASGMLHLLYVESGEPGDYMELSSYVSGSKNYPAFKFKKGTAIIGSKNKAATIPLIGYSGKIAYTFSSNKLTATVKFINFVNNTHIVVKDIPDATWALSEATLRPRETVYVNEGGFGLASAETQNGNYVYGVENADGQAFCLNATSTSGPFTFYLVNTETGDKYSYTVSGKTISTAGGTLNAISIPFSKFKIVPDYNGHDYVDLGLSVKWATMNIGASRPEECGGYFAWGMTMETDGLADDSYTLWESADGRLLKYNTISVYGDVDNKTILEKTDDAARAKWKGSWRMPTKEEWLELMDEANCSWITTQVDGMSGYKVQSKKQGYQNNWIFLPAAGAKILTSPDGVGDSGFYWSSSLDADILPRSAYNVYFQGAVKDMNRSVRSMGYSVRPVSQ